MKDVVVKIVTAEWCINCKPVKKSLSELQEELGFTLELVDADANPDTVRKLGVRGLPTTIIYKNGAVSNTIVGAKTKQELLVGLDA